MGAKMQLSHSDSNVHAPMNRRASDVDAGRQSITGRGSLLGDPLFQQKEEAYDDFDQGTYLYKGTDIHVLPQQPGPSNEKSARWEPQPISQKTHKAEAHLRRFATLNENCQGYGCAAFVFHENAIASWTKVGASGIKKGVPSRLKREKAYENRKKVRYTYIAPTEVIKKTAEDAAATEAKRALKMIYSRTLKRIADPYQRPENFADHVVVKQKRQQTRDVYLHDDPLVRPGAGSRSRSTASTMTSTPLASYPPSARLEPYHKPSHRMKELSKGALGSPWTYSMINDHIEARIRGLRPVLDDKNSRQVFERCTWRQGGQGAGAATLKTLPYSWSTIEYSPLPINNS